MRLAPDQLLTIVLLLGCSCAGRQEQTPGVADLAALQQPRPDLPPAPPTCLPEATQRQTAVGEDPTLLSGPDHDSSFHAGAPMMTRWGPLVRQVVGVDRPGWQRDYALVMAFIFIESGGRRYAISRSGCLGLMQFCDGTAVRAPYSQIFDATRLRGCACAHRRCYLDLELRRFLETTPPALHAIVAHELPCELTDPRFEPEPAIRAGWAYIRCLAERFAYNPYLIYIGYNSGPHVADRVLAALGSKRARHLPAIAGVLRLALEPNFGRAWARRRARSLVRVHLPKLRRVYRTYLQEGPGRP